jgi:hypothetical protein
VVLEKLHISFEQISERRFSTLLGAATAIKIIIIVLFYQNLMTNVDGKWEVVEGYTWDDYIRAIESNSYTVPPQKSLAGVVKLESSSYRPPVFPYYVYTLHRFREMGPLPGVVVFSILTSLVSLLAYKLVNLRWRGWWPITAGAVVFLLPMNFLKSGVLDEAVIMLPLILGAVYLLSKDNKSNARVVIAGFLLGVAVLTRYTALLCVIGIISATLWQRQYGVAVKLALVVLVVLSPWIIRNNIVLGSPVISTGGARFGVVTASDLFIRDFPVRSIDAIEIEYFMINRDRYRYLEDLSEIDREETLLAEFKSIVWSDPGRIVRSLFTKMKVFVPVAYFPIRDSAMKDIVYLLCYLPSLIMLLYRVVRFKVSWSFYAWFAAMGYALQGPLFVMTSRHMYPVIVLIFVAFMMDFPPFRPAART